MLSTWIFFLQLILNTSFILFYCHSLTSPFFPLTVLHFPSGKESGVTLRDKLVQRSVLLDKYINLLASEGHIVVSKEIDSVLGKIDICTHSKERQSTPLCINPPLCCEEQSNLKLMF